MEGVGFFLAVHFLTCNRLQANSSPGPLRRKSIRTFSIRAKCCWLRWIIVLGSLGVGTPDTAPPVFTPSARISAVRNPRTYLEGIAVMHSNTQNPSSLVIASRGRNNACCVPSVVHLFQSRPCRRHSPPRDRKGGREKEVVALCLELCD